MSADAKIRERLCDHGASLHRRGLTHGATGNLSARLPDGGWLMTPTNVALDALDPARLARLDASGRHVEGDKPTKEAFLHRAMYARRPTCEAVVHTHSTHCVAVSCLCGLDSRDCLPPLTAYYVMRVGRLPLAPYFPPGDEALAGAVDALAADHHAILLANHGPVAAGASLEAAVGAVEEIEETAKLFLLLQGMRTRPLDAAEVAELRQKFPTP